MRVFEGKERTAGGRYDIQVMLAEAHGWTPEQVDRMDPQFIAELFAQKTAKGDYEAQQADDDPKKQEARRKRYITERKLNIIKRREKRKT